MGAAGQVCRSQPVKSVILVLLPRSLPPPGVIYCRDPRASRRPCDLSTGPGDRVPQPLAPAAFRLGGCVCGHTVGAASPAVRATALPEHLWPVPLRPAGLCSLSSRLDLELREETLRLVISSRSAGPQQWLPSQLAPLPLPEGSRLPGHFCPHYPVNLHLFLFINEYA